MRKIIILPSQAQDKRRESTQKETRFVKQQLLILGPQRSSATMSQQR
jgi:hypothetical protein